MERIQEGLVVAPWELIFSAVRGTSSAEEVVAVRNTGETPLAVRGLAITGPQGVAFELREPPILPTAVGPNGTLNLVVTFSPKGDAETGVQRATLRIVTGLDGEGLYVDLSGLVLRGRQPQDEPSLQQIADALGYGFNVGASGRTLGTEPGLLGDEAKAAQFVRARPGAVAIYPAARFFPGDTVTFGHYRPRVVLDMQPLASIAAVQDQRLNPETSEGSTTFDPGDIPFGIYAKIGRRTLHSEDERNAPALRHAARAYPLKTRGGKVVPNAYLLAFEADGESDYQDLVFILWNVRSATDTPSP